MNPSMLLGVEEYNPRTGAYGVANVPLTWLEFLKHFAVAGQGFLPARRKASRVLGAMLWQLEYLDPVTFANGSFSSPDPAWSDPTSAGQFANQAGLAIADFLAKRRSGASLTHVYEGALRARTLPVGGSRPDLYCLDFVNRVQFAVEAKGLSDASVSLNRMMRHLAQASAGALPVNFAVACTTFRLFEPAGVWVNYYDPVVDGAEFDERLASALTRRYYAGVSSYLDERLFTIGITTIAGRTFYRLDLRDLRAGNTRVGCLPAFGILLDTRILQSGVRGRAEPLTEPILGEQLYVDVDGIGLTTAAVGREHAAA